MELREKLRILADAAKYNVRGEWNLVTMAYNMKRIFALAGASRGANRV